MKRKLKTGLMLAFIAALLVLFAHPDYRQGEPSLRGSSAKDFAFTLDGKPAHLSDFRGKVVLLNFWFASCPPCIEEAPSLNALQHRIAPMGGTILGVSVDPTEQEYESFLKAFNISYPNYRDASHAIALEYGTTMFPDTYIINRSGKLDRKLVGPQDWTSPEMTSYLDSLLKSN